MIENMTTGGDKHNRLSHEQRQRLEELESKLFGTTTASLSEFGKEEEQLLQRLPQGAQQQEAASSKDGPLIIWEDRQPGGIVVSDSDQAGSQQSSESDDSDREEEEFLHSERRRGEEQSVALPREGTTRTGAEDAVSSGSDDSVGAEHRERRISGRAAGSSGKRKPVWEDPHDETLQVNIAGVNRLRKLRTTESDGTISGREYGKRLKKQHAKLNPRTSWAALGKPRPKKVADESDEDQTEADQLERVRQGASKLTTGSSVLPAGLLEVTRLKDANSQEPNKAVVQSVEFHPGGQLLLTAGLDRRLQFFQIDGIQNAKVQSIYFADMPVHKAAFACSGRKVIASGRRKHFYVLDIEAAKVDRVAYLSGRMEKSRENFAVSPDESQPLIAFLGARGFISLVSWQSRSTVASLKVPSSVRAATFTSDGTYLAAAGSDGIVHTWDMRTQKCVSRFVDEGAVRGTSIASSPQHRFLATGSGAGFVNIYDQKAAVQASAESDAPTRTSILAPLKSLTNLTTAVDNLCFSPDGQMLAISSKLKKDALRLVHTGSMTVFSNWPTSRSPLNFVHSTAFSPNGGYFAAGNAKGKVLLYRLHHYPQV